MKAIKHILLWGFLIVTTNAMLQAQDTIRFTLISNSYSSFNVMTSGGGTIKVDWGDGSISTNSGGNRSFSKNYYNQDIYHVIISTTAGCRITSLSSSINKITSLDVSKSTALNSLYCVSGNLTELDLSKNTALQSLACFDNKLTSLDLTSCPNLNSFYCFNNNLADLKIAGPISTYFSCENNQLSLQVLYTLAQLLAGSPTTSFYGEQRLTVENRDVATGTQIDFNPYLLNTGSNSISVLLNGMPAQPTINYIENAGKITFLSGGAYTIKITNSLIAGEAPAVISIPLLVDPGIQNIVLSWKVEEDNLVREITLRSLPGFEVLIDWGDNTVTHHNPDPSGNIQYTKTYAKSGIYTTTISSLNKIVSLYVAGKNMNFLDVSKCPFLEELSCSDNQLTVLNLSNHKSLINFDCYNNPIKELNLSGCSAIDHLSLSSMPDLTTLNVDGCTSIRRFYVMDIPIESLDISTCISITELNCSSNANLSAINLNGCAELQHIYLDNNPKLSTLDVTACPELIYFTCSNTGLASLNVKNSKKLNSLQVNQNKLKSLDLSDCSELIQLQCDYNLIESLDISPCPKLESVSCGNNRLTSIDFGSNNSITNISIGNNFIYDINYLYTLSQKISGNYRYFNTQLYKDAIDVSIGGSVDYSSHLSVNGTQTSFTVLKEGNPANEGVDYTINTGTGEIVFLTQGTFIVQMRNTKLPNNTTIESVVTTGYNPEQFSYTWDVESKKLQKQISLTVSEGEYVINWGDGSEQEFVSYGRAVNYINKTYASKGQYKVTVKLTNGAGLIDISISDEKVLELNVNKVASLKSLYCSNNTISTLDVSNCKKLTNLDCSNNLITSLNIGTNNTVIEYVSAGNNFMSDFSYLWNIKQNATTNYINFETQKYIDHKVIKQGESVDYSSQLFVEDEETGFVVNKKNGNNAEQGKDYDIIDGVITFHKKGAFLVRMQNSKFKNSTILENTVLVDIPSEPQKITFSWDVTQYNIVNQMHKHFGITYEKGVFTIDWGNGDVEEYSSNYETGITPMKFYTTPGKYTVTIQGDKEIVFKHLALYNQNVTNIDISNCWGIYDLNCSDNVIADLKVNNCTSLSSLTCYRNKLTGLDLDDCIELNQFNCDYNFITSLDLSKNTLLASLSCYENQLENLKIPQGNDIYVNATKNKLSLNTMDAISQAAANKNNLYLHNQVVENAVNLNVNQMRSYSQVAPKINGVETQFHILKDDLSARKNVDYTINGTDITFHAEGVYSIQLRNSEIKSGDDAYGISTAMVGAQTPNRIDLELDIKNNDVWKSFVFGVSTGVEYIVDWGDGNTTTHLGEGINQPTQALHIYDLGKYNVSIATNGQLATFQYGSNDMTKLSIQACPSLVELYCSYNNLKNLDISDNPKLNKIECAENFLSFPNLLAISDKISNVNNKYLGNQYISSKETIINELGKSRDYSQYINFTAQSIRLNTTGYEIKRNNKATIENMDYSLNNGMLTFLQIGDYNVTFTNNSITSNSFSPAKIQELIKVPISNRGELSTLKINGVSIPLITDQYYYSINFNNATTNASFEATTVNKYSAILSGLDPIPLIEGNNTHIIKLRAMDGTVTEYIIKIIRQTNNPSTDASLKSLLVNVANINFTPSVYDYYVNVNYGVNVVTLTTRLNDENATVKSGNLLEGTNIKELAIGENVFTITVLAENGLAQLTYNVIINRKEPDATLHSLLINGQPIALVDGQYAYSKTFCSNTNTVNIEAQATSPTAVVEGTGVLSLNGPSTLFKVKVTSFNRTIVKEYLITINLLSPLYGGRIGTNKQICYNDAANELLSNQPATGGNGVYYYQWQSSINQLSWKNISGATKESYTDSNPLTSTTYYRRSVTDNLCDAEYSDTIMIAVYDQLLGGKVGDNQTISADKKPEAFTSITPATGGHGSFAYQWQSSQDQNTWTNMVDATGASFTENNPLMHTTYYRRAATNSNCGTAYSNTIKVTVGDDPLGIELIDGLNRKCYIYPNPSAQEEMIYLKTHLDENKLSEAVVEVYNASGTLIHIVKIKGEVTPLKLPAVSGIYILRIKTKNRYIQEIKAIVK